MCISNLCYYWWCCWYYFFFMLSFYFFRSGSCSIAHSIFFFPLTGNFFMELGIAELFVSYKYIYTRKRMTRLLLPLRVTWHSEFRASLHLLGKISLQNYTYWSASAVISRVPWLFARSQRMATHVASFDSLSKVVTYCFYDTKII